MSVAEHRALSPSQVACLILTVSDTRTLENDTSGQAIASLLEQAGHTVTARRTVRDEPADVAAILRDAIARRDARVIITTGGTGISNRDATYEAVTALFEKQIDGFGELFRMLSYAEIGAAAMLSRRFMPPEKPRTIERARSARPVHSSAASTRPRSVAAGTPCSRPNASRFSLAVSIG